MGMVQSLRPLELRAMAVVQQGYHDLPQVL